MGNSLFYASTFGYCFAFKRKYVIRMAASSSRTFEERCRISSYSIEGIVEVSKFFDRFTFALLKPEG